MAAKKLKSTKVKSDKEGAELNLFFKNIISTSRRIDRGQIEDPDPSNIQKILEQRNSQRGKLFHFATFLSEWSFLLIVTIILCQTIVRLTKDPKFEVLDGAQFNVLTVGVFGQIISVILVITRSLWNDQNYMGVLGREHLYKLSHEKDHTFSS